MKTIADLPIWPAVSCMSVFVMAITYQGNIIIKIIAITIMTVSLARTFLAWRKSKTGKEE